MKQINVLKIISIIFFLIITKNGEHVSIPNALFLIYSATAIFTNFENLFIPFIALIGSTLILIPIKRKYVVIIGYLLTYPLIVIYLNDERILKYFERHLFFWTTTIIYLLISFYVISKIINDLKSQNDNRS